MNVCFRNLALLTASLMLAEPAAAKSKTLFVDGVEAAMYGDVLAETGSWRGNKLSHLKLKAGVQIAHVSMFGLSLGYQKAGFYDFVHNWTDRGKSRRLDYYGPVLELHVLPSRFYSFSVAGAYSRGGLGLEKIGDANAIRDACNPETNCEVRREDAALRVYEYTAQAAVTVANQLQVTFGVGQKDIEGRSTFETRALTTKNPTRFVDRTSEKWESKEKIFFIGLRSSQL